MTSAADPFGPLHGLRVLEIGDGVAGAAAAGVLGSYGAAVTAVVNPDSHLRRTTPALDATEGAARSFLSIVLDVGKTQLDTFTPAMVREYDLVICDRVGGPPAGLPELADDHAAMVDRSNPGVWVTIGGFGLTGPRRDEAATELVLAAAGGLLSVVTDPVDERPVELAGSQALLSAGHIAALAACHGLSRHRETGEAVHVDVSAQAATVVTGPVMKVLGLLLNSQAVSSGRKFGAPAAFYPCRDGMLRISALEDHQWRGLTEAFGRSEWLDRYPSPADRIEHVDELDELIAEITRPQAKTECESHLQAAGVPAAAMYGPAEILDSDQFAARDALVVHSVGGQPVRHVGRPFRADVSPDPAPAKPATGLTGLRIAEVGHVLAVPLAGALLGAMGADVVRLEDVDRVDIFRRKPPYIDDEAGTDRAVYFSMVNHSKRSVALSFERNSAALEAVVSRCQVVIENLGARRAARLGIDAGARDDHPALLTVSSSAYGHTGPWSNYRAYAYNIHTGCGLLALTATPSGEPARLQMAWADVITGYSIATLIAAWAVGGEQSRGASIDLSMAELVAARVNDHLAAESAGMGGRDSSTKSSYVVDAADGLVAVEVATQEQQAVADREAGEGRSDSAEALSERLRTVGLDAEVVNDAPRLVVDQQLRAFGLFRFVDHPDWGRREMVGLPWRFVDGPELDVVAPPRFGATATLGDNDCFDPWSTDSTGGS